MPIAKYQQLYQALKHDIAQGHYRPGQMLAPSRVLAEESGLSRNTVLRAYEMLVSEGYLIGRVGEGMRVSEDLPDSPWITRASDVSTTTETPSSAAADTTKTAEKNTWSQWGQRLRTIAAPQRGIHYHPYRADPSVKIDFQYGHVEMGEHTLAQWRKLAAKWSRLQRQDYGDPQGLVDLRKALASHLHTYRGCRASSDNIVVASCAQHIFATIVSLTVNPGDLVVIEDPWYQRFKSTLELAGADILAIPTDDDGLDVEALVQATENLDGVPKLVYVTPSHQFPSGGVMSLQRRLALLEWSYRHGVWIIEDDYDSEFRFGTKPIDALQSLDTAGRVLYVGTLSKALCPSLRIAYTLVPSIWAEMLTRAIWQHQRHAAWMEQHMLAELIREGRFASHIRRQRRLYATNRQCLVEALEQFFGTEIEIQGDKAGLHLLVWWPQRTTRNQENILARLSKAGVKAYPVDHLYTKPKHTLGLLLGYATLSSSEIREGIAALHQVITATK